MRHRETVSLLRPVRKRDRQPSSRWLLVVAVSLAVVVLVGCAQSGAGSRPLIPQPSSTSQQGSPGGVPPTTATPSGLDNVDITNLTSFRQQLSAVFSKDNWTLVGRFLSPGFTFQGPDTGGNSIEMPDSEAKLRAVYAGSGRWTEASLHQVKIHFCDAGYTPLNQQMGFNGSGGSFLLLGIDLWQGAWLVFWAFQDPTGGNDACATS
jgi:hypothetical protein